MSRCKWVLLLILYFTVCIPQADAQVESRLLERLKLTHPPVDMELSWNGQKIFVLDDQGQLSIYTEAGKLLDSMNVGTDIDQIKVSPREDFLYLSSRKEKSVRILSLTFIQNIDITGAPSKGPANAPVTIIVFSDYQCPYCARLESMMGEILKTHPKDVRYVFKNFPLPNHSYATQAAQAAIAAGDQGKFWEFHDLIFQSYRELSDQKIEEIRNKLQLKAAAFEKQRRSPETMAKINHDIQQGRAAGVHGTPAVFVNGREVRPASPDNIEKAIQEALNASKTR